MSSEEMKFLVFIEQKPYESSSLSEHFINELLRINAITIKGDQFLFTLTGFISIAGIMLAILPKGYKKSHLNKEDPNDDIRILFSVLMKYRKEDNLALDELNLLGGIEGEYEGSLFAAYNLLEDYRLNGFLKRDQILIRNDTAGNVIWPYTITKKTPVFSRNYPIYNDVIVRKKIPDNENLLLLLHKFAIGWALKRYGWLFGCSKDFIEEFSYEIPCDEQQALYFLQGELRKTFILRDINVIKWMINVITRKNAQEESMEMLLLATKTFHTVWEAICGKIFSNQYSQLKSLMPQPKWTLDVPISGKAISQRPDIVTIYSKALFVLDAKYYDYEYNLPGWHDAVKQFFYALSIEINIKKYASSITNRELKKKVLLISSIINAFILPTFEDIELKQIGRVSVDKISEFGEIKAYILNARFAMQCYIGERQFPLVNILNMMKPK